MIKKFLIISALLIAALLITIEWHSYPYNFSIAAIFQNEGPYLREWIEYHRIVGVEHFYLYNNKSSDSFREILAPYQKLGLVELIEWEENDFVKSGQKNAYKNAIERAKGKTKWLAVIDVDEFLVPKKTCTVTKFLKDFEKDGIGGVGINWQMFGTSYVPSLEDKLLTEMLTLKAVPDHGENLHVKTILRPEYVKVAHVHHFEFIDNWQEVNAKKQPFKGPHTKNVEVEDIQINHYWSKDEHFFYSVKVPRRQSWGESLEAIDTRLQNLNQVEDRSIYPFLKLLKKELQLKVANDLNTIY
jgi:hypothetical protein